MVDRDIVFPTGANPRDAMDVLCRFSPSGWKIAAGPESIGLERGEFASALTGGFRGLPATDRIQGAGRSYTPLLMPLNRGAV